MLMTPIITGVALVVIKPMRAGEPATTASVMAAIQGAIQGTPEAVPTEAIGAAIPRFGEANDRALAPRS